MNKVAEMPIAERRAYAMKMKGKWEDESEEPIAKEPSVDVTKPGVLSQLLQDIHIHIYIYIYIYGQPGLGT